MKLIKRFTAALSVSALCLSMMSATAFADSSSTPATGYGTLYGSLNGKSYSTSVTKNTDNAYLTIKGLIQDRNGNTVTDTSEIRSGRGARSYSGSWTYLPSNAYAIYGTHGVQGGNTYSAEAVYTYTHI